jgi:hypothetical protein
VFLVLAEFKFESTDEFRISSSWTDFLLAGLARRAIKINAGEKPSPAKSIYEKERDIKNNANEEDIIDEFRGSHPLSEIFFYKNFATF